MQFRSAIFLLATLLFLTPLALGAGQESGKGLPYTEANLTQRQAAAILLDRFAFGPRPGELDRVVATGLDVWLEEQLSGDLPDPELKRRLASLRTLTLTAREIAATYPRPGLVRAQASREGVIPKTDSQMDRSAMRKTLRAFMLKKGYRPQRELLKELMTQKLLRAVYSENQLVEVLTDFWFNHFNVSIRNNRARPFVLPYERDAIRPHVLGHFRDFLGATAKHPAMLLYLDNAQSTAPKGTITTMALAIERMRTQSGIRGRMARRWSNRALAQGQSSMESQQPQRRRRRGINENYARELMELHTLGVDAGYTQHDVIEVARAFTGWTIFPPGARGDRIQKRIARGKDFGFVHRDDFLFRADAHDATQKVILGTPFPAGGGINEGERVLDMLARHPATARYISHQLAVRFVSDEPPGSLVERLTQRFLETSGNLRVLIRTIVYSPDFWREAARRTKVKSPLEVAVSSLRALTTDLHHPGPILDWIARMGQPLYAYNPPTGYPDRAETWINTGSLLSRMNFGLHLAHGRIPGASVNLPQFNDSRRSEPVEAVLKTYADQILPERDVTETLRVLAVTLRASDFPEWSSHAAAVGIILGSPEFQRR
jgi:uncharacterized protein (DUF1800 family)